VPELQDELVFAGLEVEPEQERSPSRPPSEPVHASLQRIEIELAKRATKERPLCEPKAPIAQQDIRLELR